MSASHHESRFFKWLVRHWICTFLLMGLGFVTFGAASVNLVTQFSANLNYMLEHGWIAVEEDGLLQLVQLLGTTYVAVAFYLLFKTCEHALVQRMVHYKGDVQ